MDSLSSSAYSLMLYGAALVMIQIERGEGELSRKCIGKHHQRPSAGRGVTRREQLSGTTSSPHRWKFEALGRKKRSMPVHITSHQKQCYDVLL
eukprot:scaffold1123_cov108-Skeletonema_dohrnii-CCMP3373.AAC.3